MYKIYIGCVVIIVVGMVALWNAHVERVSNLEKTIAEKESQITTLEHNLDNAQTQVTECETTNTTLNDKVDETSIIQKPIVAAPVIKKREAAKEKADKKKTEASKEAEEYMEKINEETKNMIEDGDKRRNR